MLPALVPALVPALIPGHLGTLHAYETALLVLLAFGPFVVLAVVVLVLRHRDAEDHDRDGDGACEQGPASRWEAGRNRL